MRGGGGGADCRGQGGRGGADCWGQGGEGGVGAVCGNRRGDKGGRVPPMHTIIRHMPHTHASPSSAAHMPPRPPTHPPTHPVDTTSAAHMTHPPTHPPS